MSFVQTTEREIAVNAILSMDDETFAKAASYIAFLMEERLEDAYDIAYAERVKNEPTVPLHAMLKECGLE